MTVMKKLREKAKISQSAMATKLGISQSYYCRIETGYTGTSLNATMQKKIARALGCPLSTLFKNSMPISG